MQMVSQMVVKVGQSCSYDVEGEGDGQFDFVDLSGKQCCVVECDKNLYVIKSGVVSGVVVQQGVNYVCVLFCY